MSGTSFIDGLVRQYTLRELPAWGLLYSLLIDNRHGRWDDSEIVEIVGKIHGYRMRLDLAEWPDRLAYFLGRWYDLPTQLLLKEALSPGDVVVDVGGNIGMFTLTARHYVGEGGAVHAFEPNPAPRERFLRHLEANGIANVTLHPFALDEREGEAVLHAPKTNLGEGSLARPAYPDADIVAQAVRIKVGDLVLPDVSPRLLKIDVEGAEIGVLRGFSRMIARARPVIVCECAEKHLQRFGRSFADLAAIADEYGYGVYRLSYRKSLFARRLVLSPVARDVTFEKDEDIAFVQPGDRLLAACDVP